MMETWTYWSASLRAASRLRGTLLRLFSPESLEARARLASAGSARYELPAHVMDLGCCIPGLMEFGVASR